MTTNMNMMPIHPVNCECGWEGPICGLYDPEPEREVWERIDPDEYRD